MHDMLDGGFADLLDSSRYRSLYIAKVYENVVQKKLGVPGQQKSANDIMNKTSKYDLAIQYETLLIKNDEDGPNDAEDLLDRLAFQN